MGHCDSTGNGHCDVCGDDVHSDEELKRGLPGMETHSYMSEFKCTFCGHQMDDRAVTFPDGEYTRELEFYCPNNKCPGPPKQLKKKELLDWLSDTIFQSSNSPFLVKDIIKKEIESGRFDV